MTEYSRMAKGRFIAGGTSQYVNLPFQPDFIELWNYTNIAASPTASKALRAWWDASLVVSSKNPTMVEAYSSAGSPIVEFDTIVNNGISSFYAGLGQQFGPRLQISGIVKASSEVTTASAHNLVTGDVVIFQGLFQTSSTGMAQIAGIPFTVTVTAPTTFTIPWNLNQTNYTALSGSPSGAFVKKVLYPYLYQPGVSWISAITTGATTTIDTTDAHNFVVGQEVAFRIPAEWGTTQLNSLPNNVIPGSPIYAYVIAVTDYNTFVVNVDSSAYTAFTSNVRGNGSGTLQSMVGLQFPQVVAVGDVNTGGVQISSGSQFYPPPYIMPIGTTKVNSINGPAIQGAYFNNTSQGFLIGPGVGVTDSAMHLMAANDVIEWRAFLHDIQ